MSDVFDSIDYTKLDDIWPLGDIEKLLQFEDRYIVLDKGSVSICKYTLDGDLVHRISKMGKGPGEYISIIDFTLNDENQIILLTRSKIIFYDFKGQFVREIPLNTIFSKIQFVKADQFLLYSPLMKNNTGKLMNKGCPITLFTVHSGFDCLDSPVDGYFPAIFVEKNLFSKNGTSILFSHTSSPIIYEYNSDLKGKYEIKINYGTLHEFPELSYQNIDLNHVLNILNRDKSITYHRPNLFHSSEWIISNIQNHGRNFFMHHISTNKTYLGKKFENDMDQFIDYFHAVAVNEETLIAYVFPSELPEFFRNAKEHSHLFETENPIIMRLHLRSYN